MRYTNFFIVLLAFITVLSSCKTNNDVVSQGMLQKRKHLKGFHWTGGKGQLKGIAATERSGKMERAPHVNLVSVNKQPVTVSMKADDQERQLSLPLIASIPARENKVNNPVVNEQLMKASKSVLEARSIWNQPDDWEKADFKKKSAIKKRSGWALFLSIMGSLLFTFLAINSFVTLLSSGILLLTLGQIALLLGGLLLSWKYKDTNGASRAAFFISWIFIGLTALFYFTLIVLGML